RTAAPQAKAYQGTKRVPTSSRQALSSCRRHELEPRPVSAAGHIALLPSEPGAPMPREPTTGIADCCARAASAHAAALPSNVMNPRPFLTQKYPPPPPPASLIPIFFTTRTPCRSVISSFGFAALVFRLISS